MGAKARCTQDLPLKVFAIETFGILFAANVCYLLAHEALVVGAMTTVIMRAPQLKI